MKQNPRFPERPWNHRETVWPPWTAGILARIESGELQPGQPIESEKDLMDTFGVARTTVRRAIAYLRETGAVRTLLCLSGAKSDRCEYEDARRLAEAALWRARRLDDPALIGEALGEIGL